MFQIRAQMSEALLNSIDEDTENPDAIRLLAARLKNHYTTLEEMEADLCEAFQICSAY